MRALLLLGCFMISGTCWSQTVSFRGQVWFNNSVVKNYKLLVDNKDATTDFNGNFEIPISKNSNAVQVKLADNNKYIILYPSGGRLLVPKDNKMYTEIVLASFTSNPYIKEYVAVSKEIKNSSGKTNAEIKSLQKKLDSISAMLYKLNYTKNDLITAREKRDGIDLFYPQITSMLRNYIVQSMDLESAFKYTSEYAFSSSNALQKLVQSINEYNPCIEAVNANQLTYAQKINDYWSPQLKQQFMNITDTILNVIHKESVLPFNDIKNDINKYFMGDLPGSKAENKKNIQARIATALPAFHIKLKILKERIDYFLDGLSNQ